MKPLVLSVGRFGALAIWAFALGLAISDSGCSSSSTYPTGAGGTTTIPGAGSPDKTGTIGIQLQLAPGITLSTVQYVIGNPSLVGFAPISGSFDSSGSLSIGFSILLPVGAGYTVTLNAVDSNGDSCTAGPAPFNVVAGQTNAVGLTLVCTQPGDAGLSGPDVNMALTVITADASFQPGDASVGSCAAVNSLLASPNNATVGHAIGLTATGIDANYQSSGVILTWTATGGVGSLGGTTGTSNSFTCSGVGTETVTVTAATADGGASCPLTGSVSVAVICDAYADAMPDNADGSDADADAPDAQPDEGSDGDADSMPLPCVSKVLAGGTFDGTTIGSLEGVTQLTSGLTISGVNVTSLQALHCLVAVSGPVLITSTSLVTLSGLDSLSSIGGYLYIASNPSLTNTNSLSGLQTVTGAIGFESDQGLQDVALPSLTSVGTAGLPDGFTGSLVFNVLASLTDIDVRSLATTPSNVQFTTIGSQAAGPLTTNFSSLTTINGTLYFSGVANLQSMSGFGSLEAVAGSLTLNALASLQNVGGLGALTTVGAPGTVASLYIASNPALTDINGLSSLQMVTGAIGFESDSALTSAALPALTSVGTAGLADGFTGSVVFNVLASLTDIDVRSLATTPSNVQFTTIGSQAAGPLTTNFASLTTINGTLYFSGVANLQTMSGFGTLGTVRGSLTLNALASLQNVGGLGGLTTVGAPGTVASLYIASNPSLTNTNGLSGLQTVTGAIGFESDSALTSAALPALTSVGTAGLPDGFTGSLVFNVLASLTNIDVRSLATTPSNVQFTTIGSQAAGPLTTNFASLTTINGTLYFSGVANLQTMSGFGTLGTVRGSLTLNALASLHNVGGLGALTTVGAPGTVASLYIASNPALTDINGLSSLQTVTGAIGFESDSALTSAALPALTSVGTAGLADGFTGSVVFNVLASLTNIDVRSLATTPSNVQFTTVGSQAAGPLTTNFASLTTINGTLYFSGVANLQTMSGFGTLGTVRGSLTLNALASLQNVGGLGGLTTVGAPGTVASLYIASNPALTDVNGLSGLQTVTGAIGFESDQGLQDVALPSLTSVGTAGLPDGFTGSLIFNVLASLSSVDLRSLTTTPSNIQFTTCGSKATAHVSLNFAALTTDTGFLTLSAITNLFDLKGMAALTAVCGRVTITGDPNLPTCTGDAFLTQLTSPTCKGAPAAISGNQSDSCGM